MGVACSARCLSHLGRLPSRGSTTSRDGEAWDGDRGPDTCAARIAGRC
jgi:hypothetical protein